jgi:hypothetical protein
MKTTLIKSTILGTACLLVTEGAYADDNIKNEFNPIETGVTSLSIAPDARGAAMGDIGAATDPDAYSQFWNPSKYAFAYSKAAVSLSYTPWLRKLVNDIFLADVSGYWKLGSNDNQAVSASLRYFSLGEVNTNDPSGITTQSLNPYELSFDVGYSRKLSEKFSMGVVFRYIYSDLGFSNSYAGDQTVGASAFSADISGYYTTYPIIGRNECQWSWGWNISNIGTKVNYNNGEDPAFLPTNLRLGTTFMFPLADYHNLALSLDLNKLLVPARPRESDYPDDTDGEREYLDALQEWQVAHHGYLQVILRRSRRIQGGVARDYLFTRCGILLQPAVLPPCGLLSREPVQGQPPVFRHRCGLLAQCASPRRLIHDSDGTAVAA